MQVGGSLSGEELHLGGGGTEWVGGCCVWMEGEPKLGGRVKNIDGRTVEGYRLHFL